MVSSILLIIIVFGILLTTSQPQTGSSVVEKPQLSQLNKDEIGICKDVGGIPYLKTMPDGIEVRCDLSKFDNRVL